jgi:alkylated DNA repair dioxygenase AlkB
VNLFDLKKRVKTQSQKQEDVDEPTKQEEINESDDEYEFDMSKDVIDDLGILNFDLASHCHIDKYLVPGTETVYYIPNYISQKDHDLILNCLINKDKAGWNELPRRIVKKYGGDVSSKSLSILQLDYTLENKTPLPAYLQPLADKVYNDFIVTQLPNHMLINGYSPSDGIMPHTDGPAYHPEVACLNLNRNSLLAFWKNQDGVRNKEYLGNNISTNPAITLMPNLTI